MHKTLLALAVAATLPILAVHADQGGVAHQGNYSVVAPLSAALPNRQMTPGATNPAVTEANIDSTVCRKGGYTRTIRPPVSYTEPLKRSQIRAYGYTDHRLRDYEEDHLVPLEVGGAPSDPHNLWPEPRHVVGLWGSYTKDQLENKMHRMVCRHQIALRDAQAVFSDDWIAGYKRYVSPTPKARHHRHW